MGNLKSIPEIRFPEFKTEWEHKPLNHYLKESKALNIDLKYDKTQVLSVSGESGCVNQIEHLGRSYAGESVHNYGVVENGDIVYTKSPLKANPFGIVRLNTGKAGIVSTLYAVYKVKEKNATGEFIDYYFSLDANTNRYLRPLVRKGAKNDMKINNAYVLHDKIYAPSVNEQKRITSLLAVTDKRLAQLKEKKALLQEYKNGTLKKLFSPKEHEPIAFREIASLRKAKLNPTNVKESYKCIELEHLDQGTGHMLGYTESHLQKSQKNVFNTGDVLYGKLRPYLRKFWFAEFDGVCSSEIWVLKANSNLCIKEYLFYLVQTQYFSQIANISSGSKMPRADWKYVSENYFHITTDKEEQMKIAKFISGIDNKISNCQRQIELIVEYKKGLLQKMFCV
jgi:type I restriction enzyme S subunit